MPFRRRFTRRKPLRRFKRKSRLVRKVNRISKALTGEVRFQQEATGEDVCTTGGLSSVLGLMVAGNTDGTRAGNKITVWSFRSRSYLRVIPDVVGTCSIMARVMVIIDKQPNGAAFAMADLLINNASDANNHDAPLNPRTCPSRFSVLMDKRYLLRPAANTRSFAGTTETDGVLVTNNENPFKILDIRKKFKKGLQVHYNAGNAGTIADVSKNAIYITVIPYANSTILFRSNNWIMKYSP